MELGLNQVLAKLNLDGFGALNQNIRLAIGPIAVVIIVALYWMLGYVPKQDTLAGVQKQQRELQGKLAEVRSIVGNLPGFQEEVKDMEVQLNIALKQLPVGRELPSLLTDISTLGQQSGLEIGLFEPKPERQQSFYAEVPIALKFEGGYHSAAIFFGKLAQLPRIVNVNDIQMNVVKGKEAGVARLSVNGTITTFRFLEGGGA